MSNQSRISSAVLLMAVTGAVCSAQSVTSAHSGTLHYFEGDVSIDGTHVQPKVGRFSEIREQGVMRTGQGRAEVLLTPGIFLRVGENSAIKLLDNRLVSTRVELLSGTAIVESDDPQMSIKDSPVSLIYKDYEIHFVKHGLLEMSSDPAQMKVYKGEAIVTDADNRVTVKEGRLLPFSAGLLTEKFDEKDADDLYLWARDRSQSLSAANMSSARTLNSMGSGYGYGNGYGSGYGYGGYGSGLGNWNGGWYFNPYFDMFTYVPAGGTLWSPFGYGFFSPGTIYSYYTPSNYWYGGGGARGTGLSGQPLASISATGRAASLNTLRSGAVGSVPGSPIRSGNVVGAPAAAGGLAAAAAGPSAGGGGASSIGASSRGGGFASGGGGGRVGGGGRR